MAEPHRKETVPGTKLCLALVGLPQGAVRSARSAQSQLRRVGRRCRLQAARTRDSLRSALPARSGQNVGEAWQASQAPWSPLPEVYKGLRYGCAGGAGKWKGSAPRLPASPHVPYTLYPLKLNPAGGRLGHSELGMPQDFTGIKESLTLHF